MALPKQKPILIQIIENRIIHMQNQKDNAKNNEEADYAHGYRDGLKFVLRKYEIWKGDTE